MQTSYVFLCSLPHLSPLPPACTAQKGVKALTVLPDKAGAPSSVAAQLQVWARVWGGEGVGAERACVALLSRNKKPAANLYRCEGREGMGKASHEGAETRLGTRGEATGWSKPRQCYAAMYAVFISVHPCIFPLTLPSLAPPCVQVPALQLCVALHRLLCLLPISPRFIPSSEVQGDPRDCSVLSRSRGQDAIKDRYDILQKEPSTPRTQWGEVSLGLRGTG